ncbi:MAG TPA: M23 family metallopeptidase [Roseococcus sp.]|nr:M23 family metallopeptidase [Roseococcus sp.]
MIGRRLALALPALALARPAAAVTLEGRAEQGGLLRGSGAAGRQLALNGDPVRVSPEGHFVIGFGRDHGPRATLRLGTELRNIEVAPREWRVQHISGLPPGQVTPDAATLRRTTAERERLAAVRRRDTPRTDFTGALAWPARGRISGVFGSQRVLNGQPRSPHYGLDIAGPTGTPIAATLPGRVTLAADFFFFGKLVVLDHGHGIHSLYAHLNDIHVAEGAEVAQGQRIADMGATGRVTGPHLHFSLGWYATWLDPEPLLPG